MPEVEKDVAEYISRQIGKWRLGSNLHAGPVRPVGEARVPACCVFCIPDGGPPPENFIGMDTSIRNHQVKVWIRGDRKKFKQALEDAREILDTLHLARISGYMIALVVGSSPTNLGEDEDGHPEMTVDVVLRVRG